MHGKDNYFIVKLICQELTLQTVHQGAVMLMYRSSYILKTWALVASLPPLKYTHIMRQVYILALCLDDYGDSWQRNADYI